jgi:hypothetical protein
MVRSMRHGFDISKGGVHASFVLWWLHSLYKNPPPPPPPPPAPFARVGVRHTPPALPHSLLDVFGLTDKDGDAHWLTEYTVHTPGRLEYSRRARWPGLDVPPSLMQI